MADRILWRRLDTPGHEIASLEAVNEGWHLSGTALFVHERRPCMLEYVVIVKNAWRTTEVRRHERLPPVLGDPVQLQQVVLNLLVNAEDAVAAGGDGPRVISVDTKVPRSGRLVFSVKDSGIGVKNPAELDTMFEHFVSSKPNGLGMGLTISRSIVEAHGGRIWAAANAGRGLTLYVELPTVRAAM